jgi:hypothetical protein
MRPQFKPAARTRTTITFPIGEFHVEWLSIRIDQDSRASKRQVKFWTLLLIYMIHNNV